MQVLLVNPPGPGGRAYIREGRCQQRLSSFAYRMMPISLPYIGALLRARGHAVEAMDFSLLRPSLSLLWERLRRQGPQLVVFCISTPTYYSDLEAVASVARQCRAHLTAIGTHVSALPDQTLAQAKLDSLVRGEPEETVAELADALAAGGNLDGVRGLSFVRDGTRRHNPDRPFIEDLDRLPLPARDLLPEDEYFLPLPRRPYALVVPSRGCPHRCSFCAAHLYYGRKPRLRRVEKIVDEMQTIVDNGRVRDIVMWSDSFTLERAWVLDICREIKRRRLRIGWMCNSRVDNLDPALAKAMREAGCTGISFGIESGSQRMLELMQKGTTVEQGRAAVAAAKAAGISVLAHFILGFPGETLQSIKETVEFALEIDPEYAQFYCAVPQPGTALWDQVRVSLGVEGAEWERFELNRAALSTPWLSCTQLERARRGAYLRFYGRWRVLKRIFSSLPFDSLPRTLLQAAGFARQWVLRG